MRPVHWVVCLAAVAAVPALADPSIKISVTQGDLADEASLAALVSKLESAANTLCKKENFSPTERAAAYDECRKTSVRGAIKEAGLPQLSAYYSSHPDQSAVPAGVTLALR